MFSLIVSSTMASTLVSQSSIQLVSQEGIRFFKYLGTKCATHSDNQQVYSVFSLKWTSCKKIIFPSTKLAFPVRECNSRLHFVQLQYEKAYFGKRNVFSYDVVQKFSKVQVFKVHFLRLYNFINVRF
jgi:hypothetical protein